MRASSSIALTICAMFCTTPLFAEPRAEPIAHFEWHPALEDFGGLSGLEVSDDGERFVAVSDDGTLYRGRFQRNQSGALENAGPVEVTPLVIETGTRPDKKRYRDMEGLALDRNGVSHISAEHNPRILSYANVNETPVARALPGIATDIPKNVGFEAFAITPDGAFVVMREGSANIRAPYTIYQSDANDGWHPIYDLPRHGGFRPVGADFGPDGHLYILTRSFNGFAFAIRIERLRFQESKPNQLEHLFTGRAGQFDNLEGLSAWRDPQNNIRLVAVSDDNFSRLQSTIFVEFLVQE